VKYIEETVNFLPILKAEMLRQRKEKIKINEIRMGDMDGLLIDD